jgi:hypothetical protein
MRFPYVVLLSVCALTLTLPLLAQSPNGVLNGLVVDPSNQVIVGADIVGVNDVTGVQYATKTNGEGIYVLPSLPPGPYRLQVSKVGFKTLIKPDIILNVQDALAINFTLPVGALSETVTVEGGAPLVNTESAAVGTVVNRQFAENLPLNGRSFQTLVQLTPGVVPVSVSAADGGQFSVSGQRAASNYWMVDGVSANIGIATFGVTGNGLSGGLPSFSVQGGTNSLVSVDALQEFRIQTSTYAPEFGRTPGGQISIVTRSGTNQWHGSAFDYLRNDVLDANDWFANHHRLAKPQERQSDFGGTFSGPIVRDRTFFFFSYEGLRLRLPQVEETTVPDLSSRQNAILTMQPYLNAFPRPNGSAPIDSEGNPVPGAAQFNASFSNQSTLDAYSLRLDHRINEKVGIFGRYNYSPSQVLDRGFGGSPLSSLALSAITTQTATVGVSWDFSPRIINDLRLNYSRTTGRSHSYLDTFGGAVPLPPLPLPSPYTSQDAEFSMNVFSLSNADFVLGDGARNMQRQVNIVNTLSVQKGAHSLKIGVDFRRLSPRYDIASYAQNAFFLSVPDAQSGSLLASTLAAERNATLRFLNLGIFVQDTWRILPRLVATYGIRWDVDFPPLSLNGPSLPAITGYNVDDLSGLALAPPGTSPFNTSYKGVAPRVGVAYQISQSPQWQTVFRGGAGVFYDLATSEFGNLLASSAYPFGAFSVEFGGTFPLMPSAAAPPPIMAPAPSAPGTLTAFDPKLQLPYTLEWNLAVEQALGRQQTLSATYVGAVGQRLIQTAQISSPTPSVSLARLVGNSSSSDYGALELQFQRRLSQGLQTVASYTWSHSIDDGSAGSYGNGANLLVPGSNRNLDRGPSDFDIRNAFSAGVTYEIPASKPNAFTAAILGGWSTENLLLARSAPAVNVYYSSFLTLLSAYTQIRPDVVSGQALYLNGAQYPGGKAFNPLAFTSPPTDPATHAPLRQGDLGRNALRGFNSTQWDFAVHRDFPIRDSWKLQFRAELFNVLNHPNLAPPIGNLGSPRALRTQFGQSAATFGQYLSGGSLGGGATSPLYQIGGPRSVQLALKLLF